MLMVSPSKTSVVGVALGPMLYVVPPITAIVEPISWNVIPPAVTDVVVGLNGYSSVVPSRARPLEPTAMVCPRMTAVVGVAFGPMVRVYPSIIASEEPSSVIERPSAERVLVGLKGYSSTVPPRSRPLEPAVIVCPEIVAVVGVALGPTVRVIPSTTARVEPTSVMERPPTSPI